MIDCGACKGVGERWTGSYEPGTGAPVWETCPVCDGRGVDPAWMVDYTTEGWERPAS